MVAKFTMLNLGREAFLELNGPISDGETAPLSGPSVISIYVNSEHIGVTEHWCCSYSGPGGQTSGYWPHIAYFCPHCGQLWAQFINTYRFGYAPHLGLQPWKVETILCPKDGGRVLLPPGADLPRTTLAVLREEFLILSNP